MKSDIRPFVYTLLLAVTVVPAAALAQAEAVSQRFGVFLDGNRIGEHRYDIIRSETTTRVRSRAEFRVKVLFINAYRYEHQANELWQNGCLTALESVTDDNGERYQVNTRTREPRLELVRAEPSREVQIMDAECPASFAYWDRERLDREALINAQTGQALPASLTREGTDTVNGEPALRYRLETEGLSPITLWYRAEDGAWLQLETTRDGRLLSYRLESTERRSVSDIDEDAGIQDPPGV